MPEFPTLPRIGLILAAAGLCGCTSTSNTLTPQLAETVSLAGTDAGYALALPDTVSVLPESAFPAGTDMAMTFPDPATPGVPLPSDPAPAAAPVLVASAEPGIEAASFVAPASPAEIGTGSIDLLITKYAAIYEVPEALVRRVVKRESTFNPRAYNRGHWGLMQIKHATARGMGYQGPAAGLFDAETNLKYAVKYLRGAWLVAEGDENRADRLYQRGYYYDAKRKGLLEETGLGRDRKRHRAKVEPEA